MTYLSGKTKQRKKLIPYAIYLCAFLALVFFWPSVRKSTYPFVEPVVIRYGVTKQSFSVLPEFFSLYSTSRKTLIAKQHELEAQVENLKNALAEKDSVLRAQINQNFETATNSSNNATPKLTLYPLMQDVTKLYSTVLLSRGFKDGLVVGDMVYIRGNQAVCTIKEVYTSSSLCLLLTANGVTTEGETSSSSLTLTLVGRGGHFLADVPRGTEVAVGEIVYLRSNPKIVVGTVKAVSNNNQDTSWHVFVEGAHNPVTSSIFYVQ